MPADCEINVVSGPCGVMAVGRCVTCGKAFCATHQARDPIDSTAYLDLCGPCLSIVKKQEGLHESQYGVSYFTSGAARADLAKSSTPKVEMILVSTNLEYKRFGKPRTIEEVRSVGTGWIIGTFDWEYTDGSGYSMTDIIGKGITVLRDYPTSDERQIFRRVSRDPDRDGYIVESGRRLATSWPIVAEAVHRLAGIHPTR